MELRPLIKRWAGNNLLGVRPSGSYAKATSIKAATDMDLFISLSSRTQETLEEIYNKLYIALESQGYPAMKQNVSIAVTYKGLAIDLVPAKKQPGSTTDHSIYLNKCGRWIKTNVQKHISLIRNSGRLDEIRAIKIWRNLHQLKFPSFYLELTVLDALYNRPRFRLADNFFTVLDYLATELPYARIEDPANSNNIVSDDLNLREKQTIAKMAESSLSERYWAKIIW